MIERNHEPATDDSLDDFFEPMLGEMTDEEFEGLTANPTGKQLLAAKRRRAEQRLEQRRLREELGDYDLEFDDL
jgi:hypothetical protein